MNIKNQEPNFQTLLQDFFCQRLINQQNASMRTVSSYRDTFRLLLRFLEKHLRKQPVAVTLDDLNAPCILAFLDHLEKKRKNSIRTRNARYAALRSFLKYAALRSPASLQTIQQTLAIPIKRFDKHYPEALSREEIQAILDTPDTTTWNGLRDRVMFTVFYNTGARVSEIIALRIMDVTFRQTTSVRIMGKGRKERTIPLWKNTIRQMKSWLKHIETSPKSPLFPNSHGQHLSRSGVESRLKKAVKYAVKKCSSLGKRRVSPHTFRHTTAMHLLQSGVDLSVIALWLGHENLATTHMYMEADVTMKERTLEKLQEPHGRLQRYQASDKLLQFLEEL
jgi:site-specific recombinase XerD